MKSKTAETVIRSGGKLIRTTTTTTVEPAEIDFADILAAVKVEHDEGMSYAPWEWGGGFEHVRMAVKTFDGPEQSDIRESRGYTWDAGNREHVWITVGLDHDLEKWYRNLGASRQVASEMVAQSLRRRIDQLTKWYEQGWEWYVCEGEFKGCSDSISGIDDYKYANGECRTDVALGIACQLEKRGYVVRGRPEASRPKRADKFLDNLGLFSWKD